MSDRSPLKWIVDLTVRQAWRVIIAVVGGTVLLVGVIMLVTPGPAMVVIPIGLAILAIEFVWAQRLIRRIRVSAKWNLRKVNRKKSSSKEEPTDN